MEKLVRTLGLRDLVFIIIGTTIGSGIFISPGLVLRRMHGQAAPALWIWVIGGVLSLLGALTYGELSAFRPQAGGLYTYLRDCFGPFAAFLYGWTLFLVIGNGSIATLAVAFSTYLGEIVPLPHALATLCSIAMIAVVTVINVRGARLGANVQNWTTAIKIIGIVAMALTLVLLGRGWHAAAAAQPMGLPNGLAISVSMAAALWAYEGWQYGTFSAGETRDAQRIFPRAFLIGLASLIGIYLFANVGYLAALGPSAAAASDRVAASAFAAVIGPRSAKLLALLVLTSIFSATNGTVLTVPRVFYAMAEDGLFFRKLAEVHPRYRTPALAIIAGSVWAAILTATGTFERLLNYVIFSGWIFYALAAAAVFVYRRRVPAASLPYRVPGYPVTPILFIVAATSIVVNTMVSQPGTALRGLSIVLVGVPVYFIWARRRQPAAAAEIH